MKIVLAAFAAMAAGALPAMAQDLIPYGEAAGWEIAVDPTVGNGCVMHSEFEDGSVVRIGFDMTEDKDASDRVHLQIEEKIKDELISGAIQKTQNILKTFLLSSGFQEDRIRFEN